MRRKTLLNRNVIIVLMLFIFLMTAFVSTAYSLWYFPNSENPKTVNTDMKVDDIEENFKKDKGSYLKIIDCRDGVIPTDADFAKSESGFLDDSINFTDKGNTFKGKKGDYSKKVFYVSSLELGSLVSSVSYHSSVFYGSGTSGTDEKIYLYDLLNSKYKLVDHLTNESIKLIDRNGTSSDGGDMDKPLDAKSYSSTKSEAYREKIGCYFFKSRILFLVPRDTETPVGDYNIYFHNEATGGDNKNSKDYSKLDHVWLWNDRTDFGVSLPLTNRSVTKDGTIYNKSLQINYETFYEACNDFKGTKQSRFIMTFQTAPTGIIFKTGDGTNFAPKDDNNSSNIEYLALPLPPNNSKFDIYINAAKDGKFTIRTDQDVDLTKNKNIVFYSASGLDHLWMWPSNKSALSVWISSNYVYKFNMAGKTVSCFSYNYGEKFNFYTNWKGPADTSAQFSHGFTFDKNEAGKKIDYDNLVLVNYGASSQTHDKVISGLFNGTSECTSIYLLEENKVVTKCTTSRDEFIKALKDLEKSESGSK